MKKLFISMLMVVFSLSLAATTVSRITLVGETGGSSELLLIEDGSYTAAYESGSDVESMMILSNSKSVLLYALVGSHFCEQVATNDLRGLKIGFTTNNVDTEYKLQFSNFEGTEFYLYDRVAHQPILVNASTPDYEFTAASGQVAVNNRFVIGVPSYSVTLNAYGWASFSSIDDLAVPAGLTAYKGALDGNVLDLFTVGDIAANQGVILYGDPGETYNLNAAASTADFSGNDLKPASAWASHSGTIFVLKDEALYQYTGSEFPANKAYLQISSSSAPKRISFRFNQPTAIENAKAAELKAEKFVGEDGQILIKRGNEVFNLQGQIVK